jgi:ferredoxin
MMLLEDHEETEGPVCGCGRFHMGQDDRNAFCYHCFMCEEECPVCSPYIPTVFYDWDMTQELARVRAARLKRAMVQGTRN